MAEENKNLPVEEEDLEEVDIITLTDEETSEELDFILFSLHEVMNKQDFYYLNYNIFFDLIKEN